MNKWSADKILAFGMVVAFLLIVFGVDIVAVKNGDMSIASLGKEIAIGLFGYMGRGAVQSMEGDKIGRPDGKTAGIEASNIQKKNE